MIYDTRIGSFYKRLDMCKQATVIGLDWRWKFLIWVPPDSIHGLVQTCFQDVELYVQEFLCHMSADFLWDYCLLDQTRL